MGHEESMLRHELKETKERVKDLEELIGAMKVMDRTLIGQTPRDIIVAPDWVIQEVRVMTEKPETPETLNTKATQVRPEFAATA